MSSLLIFTLMYVLPIFLCWVVEFLFFILFRNEKSVYKDLKDWVTDLDGINIVTVIPMLNILIFVLLFVYLIYAYTVVLINDYKIKKNN